MNANKDSFSFKQWPQILRGWQKRPKTPVKRAGYPPGEPPFPRKMLFETLEQRVLLSADLNPTAESDLKDLLNSPSDRPPRSPLTSPLARAGRAAERLAG